MIKACFKLFDAIMKFIYNERNKIFDDREPNLDQFHKTNRSNTEDEYVWWWYQRMILNVSSKQSRTHRPNVMTMHSIFIMLDRFIYFRLNINGLNKIQRMEWMKLNDSVNWTMDSFVNEKETRPSKRKTKDTPSDHTRAKTSLIVEAKTKKDRSKQIQCIRICWTASSFNFE